MEIVGGTRSGALNYIYNDYVFRLETKKKETFYLVCTNSQCPARATWKDPVFKVGKKPHNHAAEVQKRQTLKFRENLRIAAAKSNTSVKKVYHEVAQNHQEAAANYSFISAECLMRRERKSIVPPVPGNLCTLRDFLESEDWRHLGESLIDPIRPFYQQLLQGNDGIEILLFSSPELKDQLAETKLILIDGTFKIVPCKFNNHQLTTIHLVYLDKVYATVYALMNSRTKAAYILLLSFIKCEYHVSPDESMSDFEAAELQALKEVFPGIITRGCWFHYAQAIWRKHQQYGLCTLCEDNLGARKILRMLMAIPLLPANRIRSGINFILAKVRTSNLGEFTQLMNYVVDFWLERIGPSLLSVYGCRRRTNNEVESFHLQLLNQNGKQTHPAIWDFIRVLQEMDRNQTLKFRAHCNGVRYVKGQRKYSKLQDAKIKEAEDKLFLGHYSTGEFLQTVSNAVRSLERQLRFQVQEPLVNEIDDADDPLPI